MRGNNLLHDLLTEDDSEEEEEGETDSTKDYSDGDSSEVRVKAVKKRGGDFSALATKALIELLHAQNNIAFVVVALSACLFANWQEWQFWLAAILRSSNTMPF